MENWSTKGKRAKGTLTCAEEMITKSSPSCALFCFVVFSAKCVPLLKKKINVTLDTALHEVYNNDFFFFFVSYYQL